MKPRIREVIIVEGRYDKNVLSQVVDAVILTTEGFGVFRDKEKLAYFRRLAEKRGVILTARALSSAIISRAPCRSSR